MHSQGGWPPQAVFMVTFNVCFSELLLLSLFLYEAIKTLDQEKENTSLVKPPHYREKLICLIS